MPSWMKWAVAILVGLGIIAAGWRGYGNPWLAWLLPAFFVANCFVLIIVVLLQSGKAADLAGAFGGSGSQTAFGPRGAANVLSRATTWCAIMFMICALAMFLRMERAGGGYGSSVLQNTAKPAPQQTPPAKTAPAPSQPTAPSPAPSSSQGTAPAQPNKP
jgi:preprotein translocase subunit SecG